MPFAPAASAAEPRHHRGGAGSAARGRGQWVKYPARIIFDADTYAPADTVVYGKINALAQRGRCTASVDKAAGYIGYSASTVERSVRRLGTPAPTDGVTELFTRRRTHQVTGNGQTAERWCRPLERGEAHVWAPVLAADTLRGLLHRLYLALRHAQFSSLQPSLAELAGVLRHHGGRQAGQPLSEEATGRALDELEELGWISIGRRAGYRGRHAITVHDHPIHEAGQPEPTPDPGDGSADDLGAGSLASKEDQGTQRPRPQVDLAIRRRRGDRSNAVDHAGGHVPDTFGRGDRALRADDHAPPVRKTSGPTPTASAPGRYTGPVLQLSPRVWHVLAPVHHLLPGIRPYVLRRIARAVGAQLDTGTAPARLTQRLQLRYASNRQTLTDPGRWILGAALPRRGRHRGCGLDACESGVIWHTGHACQVCHDLYATDRAQNLPPAVAGPPPLPPARAWHECATCGAPSPDPLPADLCRPCRTAA